MVGKEKSFRSVGKACGHTIRACVWFDEQRIYARLRRSYQSQFFLFHIYSRLVTPKLDMISLLS